MSRISTSRCQQGQVPGMSMSSVPKAKERARQVRNDESSSQGEWASDLVLTVVVGLPTAWDWWCNPNNPSFEAQAKRLYKARGKGVPCQQQQQPPRLAALTSRYGSVAITPSFRSRSVRQCWLADCPALTATFLRATW